MTAKLIEDRIKRANQFNFTLTKSWYNGGSIEYGSIEYICNKCGLKLHNIMRVKNHYNYESQVKEVKQ